MSDPETISLTDRAEQILTAILGLAGQEPRPSVDQNAYIQVIADYLRWTEERARDEERRHIVATVHACTTHNGTRRNPLGVLCPHPACRAVVDAIDSLVAAERRASLRLVAGLLSLMPEREAHIPDALLAELPASAEVVAWRDPATCVTHYRLVNREGR